MQPPRESIKQLKASVDAIAARHGLDLKPKTEGLQGEQNEISREVGSIIIPTQYRWLTNMADVRCSVNPSTCSRHLSQRSR